MATGHVTSWSIDHATATGLDDIAQGALVEIAGAGPALVTALMRDHVELAPLSSTPALRGATVRAAGRLSVPASEALVGTTIDALGRDLRTGGAAGAGEVPVFGRDPAILAPAHRRLTLGTLVFDLQRYLTCGTSCLATGPREVLRHVLRHQVAAGRIVVYATPGLSPREAVDVRIVRGADRDPLLVEPPLPCIHVAVVDPVPAQQWLVPWTALAIADGLRARGRDVVVAIDDLDAWRPHARSRGAWSTQLAQLASRAYATPAGSVSLIALTGTVDVARASAFDHVIDLTRASRGTPPVTNSRIASPPIRVASMRAFGGVLITLARAAEVADRAHAYARVDRHTETVLADAARIRECLRLRIGATVDSLEQELALLAVLARPKLPPSAIASFIDAYLAHIRSFHGERLAKIRAAKRLDADDEALLIGEP